MDLNRRSFMALTAMAGQAAGSGGEHTQPSVSIPMDHPVCLRLLEDLNRAPAFNNHLHSGDEAATFSRYFPHQAVDRGDMASAGVADGLRRLLNLPKGPIDAASSDNVKAIYQRFCETASPRDYYHRLGDITNTDQTVFMSNLSVPASREVVSDRNLLAVCLDHLLFPLDNSGLKARHPDHDIRLSLAERDMAVEIDRQGPLPVTLDGYLRFMRDALAFHRQCGGMVCGKLGFSYWRDLDVRPVDPATAALIYRAKNSSATAYRKLQDYLIGELLCICGDLNFPVQIHSGLGADPGLVLDSGNPVLMDRLLSDPRLENCRIVFLHGAYPFCRDSGVIARRKQVWIDFSRMTLLLSPRTLAGYLREWIEIATPQKLFAGVDGAGLDVFRGMWCARHALALALTGMVLDQTCSEADARRMGKAILADNARNWYGRDTA